MIMTWNWLLIFEGFPCAIDIPVDVMVVNQLKESMRTHNFCYITVIIFAIDKDALSINALIQCCGISNSSSCIHQSDSLEHASDKTFLSCWSMLDQTSPHHRVQGCQQQHKISLPSYEWVLSLQAWELRSLWNSQTQMETMALHSQSWMVFPFL